MTKGVGGTSAKAALALLSNMTAGAKPIQTQEYQARIQKAQALMTAQNMDALYVNAGASLLYFTGTHWRPSERLVGAILFPDGAPLYIAPAFEKGTLEQFTRIEGEIITWEEHENPYQKLTDQFDFTSGKVGLDEATPFFITNGIAKAAPGLNFTNGASISALCRRQKSPAELALMQCAKDMTLAVHKATASMLYAGISTGEVGAFIDLAHKKVGAEAGSYFKIILFGPDSSFPHGVRNPKKLEKGDMVLIDTGCKLHDYISDITRSYVFGEPSETQRKVWNAEKAAQAAAFEAAQIGIRCGDVDLAARAELEKWGFGPGYNTPGLPHRTGHGIGLEIHEWPYLNWGDDTLLEPGMCFSNEPMICLYGEFGVRLEDHFYMTEAGPKWFTQPSKSIDDPFGV